MKRTAWAHVLVQALILILLVVWQNPPGPHVWQWQRGGTVLEWLGFAGILLSAYSIRSSLTALPVPTKNAQLATAGLYKYVRHPMYTSVMALALGIALVHGSFVQYCLFIALAILFYEKSTFEEGNLRKKFKDYAKYAETTPRFIPRLIFWSERGQS